jgi:hypothetical protein
MYLHTACLWFPVKEFSPMQEPLHCCLLLSFQNHAGIFMHFLNSYNTFGY